MLRGYPQNINTQKITQTPTIKRLGFSQISSQGWIFLLVMNLPKSLVDMFFKGPSMYPNPRNNPKLTATQNPSKSVREGHQERENQINSNSRSWDNDFRGQLYSTKSTSTRFGLTDYTDSGITHFICRSVSAAGNQNWKLPINISKNNRKRWNG